jgi:hypothetical protein
MDNVSAELTSSTITVFTVNKNWADKAIAQLSDSQIHIALDPETNSVAVIMKHIAGNLKSRWTDFLVDDGEKPWRDRDDEFVDTFSDRQELLDYWEEGWKCLFDSLYQLQAGDLGRTVHIRGEPHSVPLAIQRNLGHTCYHVGQILMVARILVGDDWETITIARGGSKTHNQNAWAKDDYRSRKDT